MKKVEVETASTLLTWGSKKDYRVCKGKPAVLSPNLTHITSINNVVSISCGFHHTLAVTKEGAVFGWGKNT